MVATGDASDAATRVRLLGAPRRRTVPARQPGREAARYDEQV
jgi:hypothetical protein